MSVMQEQYNPQSLEPEVQRHWDKQQTFKAFEKVDKEKFRPILKKRGFMTRDPRAKQRRKAGYAGKARARKQSPKR
jgi:ribosomal protein S9